MKKLLLLNLAFIVCFWQLHGQGNMNTERTPVLTAEEAAFLKLLDYDRAEYLAQYLAEEIGNRVALSPRRDMAADWLMSELASYGYNPYIQEFDFTLSQNAQTGWAKNTMAPTKNGLIWIDGKHYAYYGVSWSAETVYRYDQREELEITGAVVVVWQEQSQAFVLPHGDYRDKAVFVTMGTVNTDAARAIMPAAAHIYELSLTLQNAGAAAVFFQTPPPRNNPVNGAVGDTSYGRLANTTDGTAITIPVGTTLYHETVGILPLLDEEAKISLNLYTNNVGKNVIAALPSATDSKKSVYVTAHYDTTGSGPGMNDNGSGTVMLLEMARAFKGWDFGYNIVFFFCDYEEGGLRGAYAFCAEMTEEERENFVANYNMDMISTSQKDCVHFFLNISDIELRPYATPLTVDQRLIHVPEAVEIAKRYDVFNHSYLAGQKVGFDMEFFNICYDTTTDHYAFVRFGNGYYANHTNMMNAVEYDWRQNEKGTGFETLYHKVGDTYANNFNKERLKMAGNLISLAIYISAKGAY
ncbi:MAG: M28 family metallopeptidase [Bacteroidales bacterium]|nr:M28 family metallopeptidase [Bacteroidales bacterium]